MQSNVARMLQAFASNHPLLLEGPPGVGKTRLTEAEGMALTGAAAVRINFGP